MKRNATFFFVLFLTLIVLSGATVLLLQTKPAPSTPKDSVPVIMIYELDSPVRSVEIEAAGRDPFTLINTCEGEYQPEDARGAIIAGWEDLSLMPNKVMTIFSRAKGISATELLFEDADDYMQFGLDQPRIRVKTISMKGEEIVFLIGKDVPGGKSVYMQLEGKPEIYLVSSFVVDYFFFAPAELITLSITSDETGYTGFGRVAISGLTCGIPDGTIVIEGAGSDMGYRITYPVLSGVDVQNLSLLQSIFRLEAVSIIAVYPAPEEVAALGLNEPYAAIEAGYEENSFILRFSKPNSDGLSYVMREGRPVLYAISTTNTLWMGKNYFDFMEKYVFKPNISDIREVTIETPDFIYTFSLTFKDSSLSVVLGGDQTIDTGSFRSFFQALGNLKFEEGPPEPGGYPTFESFGDSLKLSIIYRFIDGRVQSISFFDGPLRRYYTYVGDGPGYLTSLLSVDQVFQDMRKMISG